MESSQTSEVSQCKKSRSPIFPHAQRLGNIFFKLLSEGGITDYDKAYRFIVSFGLLFNLYVRQDYKPKENYWTFFVSTPQEYPIDPAKSYKSNDMFTSSFKISINYYKPTKYPSEPFNMIDTFSRLELDTMAGPSINLVDFYSLDDFLKVTDKFSIVQFSGKEGPLPELRKNAQYIREQLENYKSNIPKVELSALI